MKTTRSIGSAVTPLWARAAALALVLACGLWLGGCGSSDGGGEPPADTAPADVDAAAPGDTAGDDDRVAPPPGDTADLGDPGPDGGAVPDAEPDGSSGDTAPDAAPDTGPRPDSTDDAAGDSSADGAGDTGESCRLPVERPREALAPASGALEAGAAAGFVDGPVGVSMAGFGGRLDGVATAWSRFLKGTRGFFGWGSVKAVAVRVGGEILVLLKTPMMSGEASMLEGTAEKVFEQTGIDLRGRIITSATHSHHFVARYWRLPPLLGAVGADAPDEEVIDRLTTSFADTVARALADLGPAEWGYHQADDWDPTDRVYADRRGENNPRWSKDARLTLLAFRRPAGAPLATLINFGMHGTTLDTSNDLFSEDAPGAVEMKFEEFFFARTGQPMLGLFMQSGGGDASPRGDERGHPAPQRLEHIGDTAAPMIYAHYENLAWQSEATLAVRSRRIELRYDAMGYDTDPEFISPGGHPYTWGAWQCHAEGVEAGQSMAGHPKECSDIEDLLSTMRETVPNGEVHQVYLSVARLGPLFIVTLPGEAGYSIVEYLRDAVATRRDAGAPIDLLAVSLSQDHLLYLLMPDDWMLGGYESEMSLWGPRGAQHLADRQLELVDDLLAGYGGPTFYEECPNRSLPQPFEPRAHERSIDAPGVSEDVAEAYGRGAHVRLRWTGGDPGLGSPRVWVQSRALDGTFEDVASPSGWPGFGLDNSRYHMITRYEPDPPPNGRVIAERHHHWLVDWQIPADLPAGSYRLRAAGDFFDGVAVQSYDLGSREFAVGQAEGALLSAAVQADTLNILLSFPAIAYTAQTGSHGDYYPLSGWRLLDPEAGPGDPIYVRAPLAVRFTVGESAGETTYEPTYDPVTGTHVLDLASTGIDPFGPPVTVHAWLLADHTPSVVSAPLVVSLP